MNEKRTDILFLVGLITFVVIGLGGLSFWFISNTTVRSTERVSDSRGQSPLPHRVANDETSVAPSPEPDQPEPETEITSKPEPASIRFAQYERVPDGYVGTAKCAACHQDRHQSYLLTHHSRSLREVETDQGAGKSFAHPPSRQVFDVVDQGGQTWHRQWRQFSATPGDRMLLSQFPVAFVMGSGAFGKAYLLADRDFLLQSPVTWYAGSEDLGMAPGYDRVHHVGMTRVIQAECMFCHAGLLSQRDDNPNLLAIHELSIGCERCHGPGEAHAKLYERIQLGEISSRDIDPKIVHPAKLDRRRSESICGQCHLHGDIVVHPPDRQIWDFVAGQDLAQTRLHYKFDKPGEFKDSFTGHFDQMWQSKCYLHSETLTCLTCHDPHQVEQPGDLAEVRRQQCNRCHDGDQHCGLPLDRRLEQAGDRCTECHMPRIESEVPHTSTTSHLIAVYDQNQPRGVASTAERAFRRLQLDPAIPDQLVHRADALAKASWLLSLAREGDFDVLESAEPDEELKKILVDQPDDDQVHSLLAHLKRVKADRLDADPTLKVHQSAVQLWKDVERHAVATLRLDDRPSNSRAEALAALSSYQMRSGEHANATNSLIELTQIRRNAVDWYNLGLCYGKLRQFGEAERAFREAIRLDGTYVAPYRSLSRLYRSANPKASQQLEVIARRLMLQ